MFTMTPATPTLVSLPPELIYEIGDNLPLDAILALKFAHPTLNATLPLAPRLKNTALSSCARLAIRTYLRRSDSNHTHVRCILCKATYPPDLFHSSSSPACLPLSFTKAGPRPEVVELPQRFCAWHVGRLVRVVRTQSGGRNEWVSTKRHMCMHCGVVQGWGECDCNCDSCGFRSVRTYTRYLNNNIECMRYMFWRKSVSEEGAAPQSDGKGLLFVRETCWDPDATESPPVLNLPVRYEDETFADTASNPGTR